MESETKQCQSCKQEFTIAPEDFEFYEKIQVPPPTWCPSCRQRRRYALRNERVLYRRPCDLCAKSMVTIYSPNKPFKVYCPSCWWGDSWDAGEYGVEYDFNRSFFEQWQELQIKVPRMSLLTKNSVNSDYTNHSGDNKDCFLSFSTFNGENIIYSTNVYGKQSRDCMDSYRLLNGAELMYECLDSNQSYNCQFSFQCHACSDCLYSYDLKGCSNCIFSYNLRNKSYCILNKQYTKEEYQAYLQQLNLGSFEERKKLYDKWREMMETEALHKYANIDKCLNVSGNNLANCKETYEVFEGDDMDNVRYTHVAIDVKDARDMYHCGLSSELLYESQGVVRSSRVLFSHLSYDNHDIQYCDSCQNSNNLFGCVSVNKSSYRILNKQYSKEEYHNLKEKIIEQMRQNGEYGEFFPASISPIGYNETQGEIYMPMNKEEALALGYKWEDLVPGTYGKETLQPEQIPDNIADVTDDITKLALKCVSCTKNYNIVPAELLLYRQYNAPIPRECPDCRYKKRIATRLPRELWNRQCMCTSNNHEHNDSACQVNFNTPYSPDRKDKVLCEKCYQQEVV